MNNCIVGNTHNYLHFYCQADKNKFNNHSLPYHCQSRVLGLFYLFIYFFNLGLTLFKNLEDQNLSWNNHISHIIRKSVAFLQLLLRFHDSISKVTRQLLVSSLVLPHFDKDCLVYGGLLG